MPSDGIPLIRALLRALRAWPEAHVPELDGIHLKRRLELLGNRGLDRSWHTYILEHVCIITMYLEYYTHINIIYVYIYVCIYTDTYMMIHMYTHACVHIYIYVCTCL